MNDNGKNEKTDGSRGKRKRKYRAKEKGGEDHLVGIVVVFVRRSDL